MGLVRMGPPIELIIKLRDDYGVKDFIETGTFRGDTALWASGVFERVVTIEKSEAVHKDTVKRLGLVKNIEFLYGDTRKKLAEIVPGLKGSTIFWLDAHWSGGETYGMEDQCPLLDELGILNRSKTDHFIFIDDARLFLSPPQPPHLIESWPDISSVIWVLNSQEGRYIVIIEDTIIAVPCFAKPLIAAYCHEVNRRTWKEYTRSRWFRGIKSIIKRVGRRIKD